jgi:hypothetical protein
MMRRAAAAITAVLTSGVAISLNQPNSIWHMAFGLAALAASLLTLAAGWFDGGSASQSTKLAEMTAEYSSALGLYERLEAYAQHPDLFEDIPQRLGETAALVDKLAKYRGEQGTV